MAGLTADALARVTAAPAPRKIAAAEGAHAIQPWRGLSSRCATATVLLDPRWLSVWGTVQSKCEKVLVLKNP